MKMISNRDSGLITVTDEFCGAGGSTTGAKAAGLEVKMAMNHWDLAIESHNTNHPEVDHDCRDISASDPRRYPTTTMLIASPECTNHSVANGKTKPKSQGDLFKLNEPEPDSERRSRATMWDVPRFAEYHKYECIIVENVVDARRWIMWDAWIHAMRCLGYRHRSVYLNSMFCWPTPQSRDRLYVVFWKKGNPEPDLNIKPPGYCTRCNKDVACTQSWKDSRRKFGKYGKNGQYIYKCPNCASEVVPYYYAAINIIDWSIKGKTIGERDDSGNPLKPKTLERIQYAADKHLNEPAWLVATNKNGDHVGGILNPGFFQKNYGGNKAMHPLTNPLGAITCSDSHSLITPSIINLAHSGKAKSRSYAGSGPLPTQTSAQTLGIAMPPELSIDAGVELDPDGPPVICVNKDGNRYSLIDPRVFLSYYYSTHQSSTLDHPLATIRTVSHASIVDARGKVDIRDYRFRMFTSDELLIGQGFDSAYVVLGTQKEKVKQIGNAVSPPSMRDLCKRVSATLQ